MKKILNIALILVFAATLCAYTYEMKSKKKKKAEKTAAGQKSATPVMVGTVKQFVGATSVTIDGRCRKNDQCDMTCKSRCETQGGNCWRAIDAGQECLTAHPRKKTERIQNAEQLLTGMQACLKENHPEFEKYRCTFSTSELDARLFIGAGTPGCQMVLNSYKQCLQGAKPEISAVKGCQDRYRGQFETFQCSLGTSDNTARLYDKRTNDMVGCYINCAEIKEPVK